MTNSEVVVVACRKDNYAYLVHGAGTTLLVDAPEAGPILKALAERGWHLDGVLVTHHHGDHIDGIAEIVGASRAPVFGAAADRHRLPPLDKALVDGETFSVGSLQGVALATSGHTVGHLCYHFPEEDLLFSGDTLFSLGCGRLFEGSAAAMWQSLQRLAALPDATAVCPGHEYTLANGRFALAVDPDNAALARRIAEAEGQRAAGLPTVPSRLDTERATNPFLRAGDAEVARTVGLAGHPAVEVFAELRRRKDAF